MKLGKNRDYDYFGRFGDFAQAAVNAAHYLDETLKSFDPATFAVRMDAMHEIEHDADGIKHEMMQQLAHEFMTPIEREDIATLSQELDNVVDSIDDVMRRLYMFNITEIRPAALDFSTLIVQCTEALEVAVREFRFFKKSKDIVSYIVQVNTLESEGDALHVTALRELFTNGDSMKEAFLWMQMYECLEACLDACENASDVVENIIMKNT